ncbi:hypothetical protein EI94DRAFT_1160190 [Lactarius quietus]|nr:hypothetical protein EI94DRAFT_1160190 [Lactarius quietus]
MRLIFTFTVNTRMSHRKRKHRQCSETFSSQYDQSEGPSLARPDPTLFIAAHEADTRRLRVQPIRWRSLRTLMGKEPRVLAMACLSRKAMYVENMVICGAASRYTGDGSQSRPQAGGQKVVFTSIGIPSDSPAASGFLSTFTNKMEQLLGVYFVGLYLSSSKGSCILCETTV